MHCTESEYLHAPAKVRCSGFSLINTVSEPYWLEQNIWQATNLAIYYIKVERFEGYIVTRYEDSEL